MKMKGINMEMVPIPGGTFKMGSTREEVRQCTAFWVLRLLEASFTKDKFYRWICKEWPAHPVLLKAYSISKYPVTNAQYRLFCLATKTPFPESIRESGPENHPVWGVRYSEAVAFSSWFSKRLGKPFQLPTEAEWEFAARGPERLEYPYGNTFNPAKANTLESDVGTTTPVDAYEKYPSPFGVRDMAGNVEEWTTDLYAPYPGGDWIEDDLAQTLGRRYRVLRGGSFARGGDLSRCTRRHGPYQGKKYRYVGFRLVIED